MQAEFLLSREQNSKLEAGDTPNRSYRFHFHSHIEISIVTEGEMEVWINDQCRVLREGEISVAWSYDAHSYRTIGNSRSLWIVIPPDFFSEILPTLGQQQARESFLNDPILYEKLGDAIRSIIESKSEITRRGYVYVILGHLLNISPMQLWHGFAAAPTSITSLNTEERVPGTACFRVNFFGATPHLDNAGVEPSRRARYVECAGDPRDGFERS
jgi:hypothetical protein